MKRQVLIVGAGASGLMAAIHGLRAGARVTLLEHKERAGKKILSTGNGRCNLTNLDQREEYYRCSCPGFPYPVIKRFPAEHTMEFFRELGILPKNRRGYLYPNSDQASSVLEALLQEIERLGGNLVCECRVTGVGKEKNRFFLSTDKGVFQGDALILAAGSKAAPVTGSDGSGYKLAERLGHRILTPLPALVQLRCGEKHYRQLAGVRTEARVELYVDGTCMAWDTGELQLTDYGISGIPVFQISRYGSIGLHRKQKVWVRINFLPELGREEVEELMEQRRRLSGEKTCRQWMNGLLNSKLSMVLLKLAGISPDQKACTVSDAQWRRLANQLTSYKTTIVGTNPFENAQVCCGGVDPKQVFGDTLESRLVPGLYFCGEILDVDGICGGYNLQWAWSSGAVAGRAAAGILSPPAGRTAGPGRGQRKG